MLIYVVHLLFQIVQLYFVALNQRSDQSANQSFV